jgi:hypothetical protein
MFTYNFNKAIKADKLQQEIWDAGMNSISYIDTVGTDISIYFSQELTSEQISTLQTVINNHNPLTSDEYVRSLIRSARAFGSKTIEDFATENVMLGITQDKKTRRVRKIMREVKDSLDSGSLKDAIIEVKLIPPSLYDSKYITATRLLAHVNKIEAFLGVTLSSDLTLTAQQIADIEAEDLELGL